MKQLSYLSLFFWPLWAYYATYTPEKIETVIFLFAAAAFSGLLALHLIIWSVTGGKGLNTQ